MELNFLIAFLTHYQEKRFQLFIWTRMETFFYDF
jgi:hypothetical protein